VGAGGRGEGKTIIEIIIIIIIIIIITTTSPPSSTHLIQTVHLALVQRFAALPLASRQIHKRYLADLQDTKVITENHKILA
jgi:Tfp pilus assembly protein PilE